MVIKAEEMNMFSLIIIQFSFVTVRHILIKLWIFYIVSSTLEFNPRKNNFKKLAEWSINIQCLVHFNYFLSLVLVVISQKPVMPKDVSYDKIHHSC